MKRSEAIEKFYNKFVEEFDTQCYDYCDIENVIIPEIFDFLEKELGMLPPRTVIGTEKQDHVIGILTVNVYKNSWEPEND